MTERICSAAESASAHRFSIVEIVGDARVVVPWKKAPHGKNKVRSKGEETPALGDERADRRKNE
jgi:hypothetical protein